MYDAETYSATCNWQSGGVLAEEDAVACHSAEDKPCTAENSHVISCTVRLKAIQHYLENHNEAASKRAAGLSTARRHGSH